MLNRPSTEHRECNDLWTMKEKVGRAKITNITRILDILIVYTRWPPAFYFMCYAIDIALAALNQPVVG